MRWTVLAFALLLLPGCVSEEPEAQALADDGAAVATPAEALNVTLAPLNASVDDAGSWLASVTPEAAVAGFRLSIPAGSAHPYFEDSIFESVMLAVAPVVDTAPEGLAVAVYDLGDGHLITSHLMVPVEGTIWLTAALPSDLSAPADYEPAVLQLPDDVDGTEVGIVVAARGLKGPAGVLLSVDDAYQIDMDPPGREALERRGVGALVPRGTGAAGDGFTLDLYEEIHASLVSPGPGIIGAVMTAGEPVVEQRLPTYVPPHGGARDDTITTGGQEAGWAYSVSEFICGEGAAKYTASVQVGDADATADGVLVWADGYGLIAGALVTGLPVALGEGDGPGVASAGLSITAVESNSLCIALVETLGFPVPLATLLGQAAPAQAVAWTGLLGESAASAVHVAGVPDFAP